MTKRTLYVNRNSRLKLARLVAVARVVGCPRFAKLTWVCSSHFGGSHTTSLDWVWEGTVFSRAASQVG
jgi:hypothetical protein